MDTPILSRLIFVLSLLLSCITQVASPHSPARETVQAPSTSEVEIDVSKATYDCATGITFDWRIRNVSHQAVYIYSPFLEGQSADLLEYDKSTDTVHIPTSLKSETSFSPLFVSGPYISAVSSWGSSRREL